MKNSLLNVQRDNVTKYKVTMYNVTKGFGTGQSNVNPASVGVNK